MSENLNINEILNLVRETNKELVSEVFVPSMNKTIHMKPMNAAHLKSIIKTSVSGVFANNTFNQVLFTILSDIIDPSISTHFITTFDKVAILLQLRRNNVKSTINVEFTDGEPISVSLDSVIEKIVKGRFDFSDHIISEGGIELTVSYPSIEQEFLSDRHFEQTKIKKIDEEDKAALKDLFGPLFIQEITQYIKNIKIKDQMINVLSLPVGDRLAVVESLPGSVITALIGKIDEVFGKQITEILTVETTVDGNVKTGTINLGPSLFA